MPEYSSHLEAALVEMMLLGWEYDRIMRFVRAKLTYVVMRKCEGNQCAMARLMHMHRNSVRRHVKEMLEVQKGKVC